MKTTKQPKVTELRSKLQGIVSGSMSNRVAALSAAVQWYDAALPFFLSNTVLTAEQTKKFDLTVKLRNMARPEGNIQEAETGLRQTLKIFEALFGGIVPNTPSHTTFWAEYESRRAMLEQAELALKAKFQAVIDLLNAAYQPAGIEFSVVASMNPRQFDGTGKIFLGDQYVAELSKVMQKQGAVEVVFAEALYVTKALGVVSTANGPVLDLKTMAGKLPSLFAGMKAAFWAVPKSALVSGSASAATGPKVAAGPKAPRVPSNAANLVAGRYKVGSFLAQCFILMSDGAFHTYDEIAKVTGSKYPKDGPYYLGKEGAANGKWTINKTKQGAKLVMNP